ncbi:MAG TPA: metal-dependent phosphohydrolase [Desulfobulbaceae bacterium]|nr:MAG: metal-dependent phosphohydrolase [Deltaproteobacteria bacterium RIFOXYD12_FULL_53_23]HCC54219.1 metal-dependent phosphohydrolase [Desulfobulbaceae bacterium]
MSAAQQLWESEQNYRAFAQIGLALSGEKDNDRLLEMIVDAARLLSKADGATLYIVEPDGRHLRFAILQNDTMKTRLRGTDSGAIFPQVPLYHEDGKPNHDNVASYVALTDQLVNIPDVYKAADFDFTGPRRYDMATGYRSKSMLVISLKNHMNEIIGVLQLINAMNIDTGEVIAFSNDYVKLVSSLASQAAMSLTNIQLVKDQQNLFYAFIKSIATAIDEKSPYTGGHIRRVYDLTMMIAEKVNETEQGPFGQVRFSKEELEELRLSAWMHDVGKITTPDYVVDKADKLQTIFSRLHLIETRFGLIIQQLENEFLRHKIALIEAGETTGQLSFMEAELARQLLGLKEDMAFIQKCNVASEFMSDDKIARIKAIATCTYICDGEERPYLSADEVENLCIRKGNLNERERKIIDNHATMTSKILNQLPFPKNLAMVPNYAGGHHEKLNGSGYPLGLTEDQLPLQIRILAIADIFEALTAKDRPYREPMRLSQAIRIMDCMKKDHHIDPTIFDLFVESGLCHTYAAKEMKPEQIDS